MHKSHYIFGGEPSFLMLNMVVFIFYHDSFQGTFHHFFLLGPLNLEQCFSLKKEEDKIFTFFY